MEQKQKILVVEDEEAIQKGLEDVLVYHGFDVECASDGEIGLQKALTNKFDLILLDVMMPKRDGFSVCNEIRKKNKEVAIMMLTAKNTEQDIINGLTLGADDYVSKPFSVRELVLRITAVLRRAKTHSQEIKKIQIGALDLDVENLEGNYLDNREIKKVMFSKREVEILHYLFENHLRPVSRDDLLKNVWGYANPSEMETRTVDIHMAKLRNKIELDSKNPEFLITVRGQGYRLKV